MFSHYIFFYARLVIGKKSSPFKSSYCFIILTKFSICLRVSQCLSVFLKPHFSKNSIDFWALMNNLGVSHDKENKCWYTFYSN